MRGVTIVKDGRTTNRQKMKDKIREEKIECQETNLMAEIDQVLDKYLEEAKKEFAQNCWNDLLNGKHGDNFIELSTESLLGSIIKKLLRKCS